MATNNVINNAFGDNYTAPNKVSKNAIIGGDFSLNPWQRGTSVSVVTGTTNYLADRFNCNSQSTLGVATYSKFADAPTSTEAQYFTTNCMKFEVTAASGAPAAADFFRVVQNIEGYNFAALAQRPFTISFWAKTNKIGTYCISVRSTSLDNNYIAEYTMNVINTWEFKSITIPASPSTGTWDYINGIGLRVNFTMANGATNFSPPNVWASGNNIATSNQVNLLDTIGNTFQFALIQVEPGSVATPFEQRSIQETLSACQRYYFKTFPQGTTPVQNVGNYTDAPAYRVTVAGISAQAQQLFFPVTMRAAPTMTYYNPLNTNSLWRNVSTPGDSGASSTLEVGDASVHIGNAQAVSDPVSSGVFIHATASAEL